MCTSSRSHCSPTLACTQSLLPNPCIWMLGLRRRCLKSTGEAREAVQPATAADLKGCCDREAKNRLIEYKTCCLETESGESRRRSAIRKETEEKVEAVVDKEKVLMSGNGVKVGSTSAMMERDKSESASIDRRSSNYSLHQSRERETETFLSNFFLFYLSFS